MLIVIKYHLNCIQFILKAWTSTISVNCKYELNKKAGVRWQNASEEMWKKLKWISKCIEIDCK